MSTDIKAQFMADKCLYDGLSQAVRLAKNSGLDERDIKPLILLKQKHKKIVVEAHSKLLKIMPLSQNTLPLGDDWYAIRYLNDKTNTEVKIEIMKDKDIGLLARDGRYERELTRKELDTMLPGLIDEDALELYKQSLQKRARELVFEHTGVLIDSDGVTSIPLGSMPINGMPEVPEVTEEPIEEDDEFKPVTVSVHAGMRYVQRRLGIKNEVAAEEYRRKNTEEVIEAVLDGFGTATKVWEDDDEIAYWFDPDNLMYVVGMQGGNPNIITLYEEDFGFDKHINRLVAEEQLKVLAKVKNELNEAEANTADANERLEGEVNGIKDEITALESQIEMLVAKRAKLIADRDLGKKGVKAIRDRYNAEFNKLFKKWDA